MVTHFFVDETKAKSYLAVAVACPGTRLGQIRAELRPLVLPGQRSIHMKTESPQRRRLVLGRLLSLSAYGVRAFVADAARLVLDLDETRVAADRRHLYAVVPQQCREMVTYEHARRNEEQLLALPDAVAWCWARGGEWRRAVTSLVAEVITVQMRGTRDATVRTNLGSNFSG